ncbi:hypothetical protein KI387_017629, partial [Taxus chinensis]
MEVDKSGKTSGSGGTGFAKQNNLVDGAEYNVRNGNTNLKFGTHNCDTRRDNIGFGKENGNIGKMGSRFGGQKNVGHTDVGMGGNINSEGGIDIDNQNRGPPGHAMTLQNDYADIVHIGSQGGRDVWDTGYYQRQRRGSDEKLSGGGEPTNSSDFFPRPS